MPVTGIEKSVMPGVHSALRPCSGGKTCGRFTQQLKIMFQDTSGSGAVKTVTKQADFQPNLHHQHLHRNFFPRSQTRARNSPSGLRRALPHSLMPPSHSKPLNADVSTATQHPTPNPISKIESVRAKIHPGRPHECRRTSESCSEKRTKPEQSG